MAQSVKIQTSAATKYAQIIRAATAGAKAANEIGNSNIANEFMRLKAWADYQFKHSLNL